MQYPNHIEKKKKTAINYGNRGMDFEYLINLSNSYYIEQDIALIYKKPTPVQIVNAHYTKKGRVIDEAYFNAPSTLDYNGIYRGKYIEFEAKETKNKTSFPLANIHAHQIEHLKKVIEHGGIAFLLLHMNHEVFLLDGTLFLAYIKTHQRKSIPFSYISMAGQKLEEQIDPPLPYLKVVDNVYFGGK